MMLCLVPHHPSAACLWPHGERKLGRVGVWGAPPSCRLMHSHSAPSVKGFAAFTEQGLGHLWILFFAVRGQETNSPALWLSGPFVPSQ